MDIKQSEQVDLILHIHYFTLLNISTFGKIQFQKPNPHQTIITY